MVDTYLVGKLEEKLVIETQQEGEVKTLILPKGIILEFKISTDYDHYVGEGAYEEVEDYIRNKGLELKNIYNV